jgi:hypothetical protein
MGAIPAPLRMGTHTPHTMPRYPSPAGLTAISLELRTELVDHLDRQAEYLGMSRAAYLRQLIVKDSEREGPAPARA